MLRGICLLFILSIFLQTNALHLAHNRCARLETVSDRKHENSTSDQLRGNVETEPRNKTDKFIECVLTLAVNGSSEYASTYSGNVKMGLRKNNAGPNILCSKRDGRTHEEKSDGRTYKRRWSDAIEQFKQLARYERRATYRVDAEIEGEGNEEVTLENDEKDAQDDDIPEEPEVPEVAQPPDDREEETIGAKFEKDGEGEGGGGGGGGGEGEEEAEEEKEEEEEEEGQPSIVNDDHDRHEGSPGDEQQVDDPGKNNKGEMEKVQTNIVPDPVKDQEEKVEMTTEKVENRDDLNGDNGDQDNVEDDDDKVLDCPKCIYDFLQQVGKLDLDIDLHNIVTPSDIYNFITGLGGIFSQAGDYILSLLLRDLKRSVYRARMNEKFNGMVDKLAESQGGDNERAMRILRNRIRKHFGKSYHIELVKFLKLLHDNTKL